jgi:hypothetical protein
VVVRGVSGLRPAVALLGVGSPLTMYRLDLAERATLATTNEIRLFSALVEEDAFIEFITPEAEGTLLSWEGTRREGR